MPAIPAVTIRSHVTLDVDPLRLKDESFVLMERARISATSGNSQRFVDLAGNCFLRVESDQRLQYTIDFTVLQNANSLGDYYPGRALSDRSLAFATAGTTRPHQFKEGGIFIYESSEDTDNQGELRKCSVNVSYDLHGGVDTVNYPTTSGTITYADIPVQTYTEVSDELKNYLLLDIFNGQANLEGNFTIQAYNGNPLVSGTPVSALITLIDPWQNVTAAPVYGSGAYGCSPNEAIVLDSSTSGRSCTHFQLKRGSIVICTVALASTFIIPANAYLRIPSNAITVSLYYPNSAASDTGCVHPSKYFLPYILGGTRFTHLQSSTISMEIYTELPNGDPSVMPVDSWIVEASSAVWTVAGTSAMPPNVEPTAIIEGFTPAPSGGWDIYSVVAKPTGVDVQVAYANYSSPVATVIGGAVYEESTIPIVYDIYS